MHDILQYIVNTQRSRHYTSFYLMNPKQFLMIGGIVLLVVGIAGFVVILGPTASQSIFGPSWYFDNGENWAHTILGAVALIVAFALPAGMQAGVTLLVGVVGLIVGLWGFLLPSTPPNFYGANLENPLDNILHLAVGLWAIISWRGAKKMMSSPGMKM